TSAHQGHESPTARFLLTQCGRGHDNGAGPRHGNSIANVAAVQFNWLLSEVPRLKAKTRQRAIAGRALRIKSLEFGGRSDAVFGVDPPMSVLTKLATALNRRDEIPNQALAEEIVKKYDVSAVRELVDNLSNPDKGIQSDCIKVLYEIGERDPKLIAKHWSAFGELLGSANNRLVWGAMTALDQIALAAPQRVFGLLSKIRTTAKTGSVITRDHAVGILTKLGTLKQYANACFPLLIEQLKNCPNNQLPMYAEMSLAVATDKNKSALHKAIAQRMDRLEKESQKKRVLKVLKRLTSGP